MISVTPGYDISSQITYQIKENALLKTNSKMRHIICNNTAEKDSILNLKDHNIYVFNLKL